MVAGLLMVALGAGGCSDEGGDGPVTVQPGAPGEPAEVLPGGAPEPADQPHTPADVEFLHGMLAHHAQALRMTGLVSQRTQREQITLFAQRIEISQEAEISQMESWLEARDEPVNGGGHDHGAGVPGMLSEAQLAELEAATGTAFDRRFLELMIIHHEGALTMVANLHYLGGGQEMELYELVTHIDADQRIEIDRMRELLAELPAA